MYIDYANLWKLLIDKNMTKSELMELTGISSRVLAKMTKNETVTTDTIARICDALNCDVGDIMECAYEDNMSIYNYFRKFGKKINDNDLYSTFEFTLNSRKFVVHYTKNTANKFTQIDCRQDTLSSKQTHPVGHIRNGFSVTPIIKPKRGKGEIVMVIIKGKPEVITGLDEGIFVSSRGSLKKDSDVYVMSEAAFKLFALTEEKTSYQRPQR